MNTRDKEYYVDGQVVTVEQMALAWTEKQSRDRLRQQQQTRADKYGIGAKEGGRLSPPSDFPQAEGEYGDPVNFRYPADAAHAKPALSFFNQSGQMGAGGYSSEEWGIIGRRLARLISRHLEADYQYSDGKLSQKTEKGEVVEKSIEVAILEKDEERHLAYGVILRPDVTDAEGDLYDTDDVEKAAHWYLVNRPGATDWLHEQELPRDQAVLVESVIMGTDVTEWHGKQVDLKKGDWLGVVWIPSDDRWQAVKAGEINAFSIRGVGRRQALDT
jgi:hypothetical protein